MHELEDHALLPQYAEPTSETAFVVLVASRAISGGPRAPRN